MRKDREWKWLHLAMIFIASVTLMSGCGSDDDDDPVVVTTPPTVTELFATSLHGTREGKATWYNDTDGFNTMVTVDYSDLPCAD